MSKHTVLFLCVGNSARSQMAEAILKAEAGDQFDVHSAGTAPKTINPLTIQVMGEIGIDIGDYRSKGIKELLGRLSVWYLIIVCQDADENCPRIWPGMLQRLVWPLDDPASFAGTADQKLEKFRLVRDQIQEKIRAWLQEVAESP